MAEWSVKGTRGLRLRVFISFVLQEGFNQFCFPRQPEMLSFAIRTTRLREFLRHTRQCFCVDVNTGGKIAASLWASYK